MDKLKKYLDSFKPMTDKEAKRFRKENPKLMAQVDKLCEMIEEQE